MKGPSIAELIEDEFFDGCTLKAIRYDRERGLLNIYVEGQHTEGERALQFKALIEEGPIGGIETRLDVTEDEPRGAGQDPYGRPSPTTHPEYWRE